MAGLIKSLGSRSSRQSDLTVVRRAARNEVVVPTIKGGTSLLDRIASINALVSSKLGKYEKQYQLLRTEEEVIEYFNQIIDIGSGSIDTETTSLDPMLCTLAGICLYAPGLKPSYIPVNHVSYITNVRAPNQIDVEVLRRELKRTNEANIEWAMHNADYDTRVVKHQIGIEIPCGWDTYIAAKCLNENEPAGLKPLHLKYCDSQDTESLDYNKLFDGVPFTHVPITTAYLYAAGDAVKTYELMEFQKKHLTEENLPGSWNIFKNVEMPLIPVISRMEDTGVAFDMEYAQELSLKYATILEEATQSFYTVLEMYEDEITKYKQMNPGHKLSDPINIGSPTQIAVILYDILGLTSTDSKKARGTGEEILLGLDTPVARAVLEYRGVAKLLSTYIDKMPAIVNPNTHRIHASFNQYGAVTGRLSSSDPKQAYWGQKIRLTQGRALVA